MTAPPTDGAPDDRRTRQARRALAVLTGLPPDGTPSPSADHRLGLLVPVTLLAGEVLFTAGDAGDSLYVVVSGRLRVLVTDAAGTPRAVRELGRDEIVGELALLTGEARTATVLAVRDSELLRVPTVAGRPSLLDDPVVLRAVTLTLARRMQRGGDRGGPTRTGRSIAVVPAGGAGPAAVADLAHRLAGILRAEDRVAVLSAASVDEALGPGTADGSGPRGPAELTGWLSAVEDDSDVLLYVVGDRVDAWARRAVRQADVVLLVAPASAAPLPGAVERGLLGEDHPGRSARELVLLHPTARAVPEGTGAWLRQRIVDRHHHVALDRPEHLARLARLLVGRAVGLVLSGGGVRGVAHIGVMRALREHGVPVDVVCGTSAGALVGAQLAMGWDDAEIERRTGELLGGPPRRLLDWTVPVSSLVGGVRFNRVLRTLFGDTAIEDLWLPYLCTVTDLTSAELVVHGSGPLHRRVRASCALPLLLPPVVEDGHLHVDGGVLNNLPVTPLLARVDVGTLVLSDASMPFYTADEPYTFDDSLPALRVLNARLNPFARRLVAPGLVQLLMRAMEIGTKSLEAEQVARADVHVRPRFLTASYTDTAQIPALVRAGYDTAVERLADFDPAGIPFR